MITAVFEKRDGRFVSFDVCGHAGYAGAGEDIVCAGVSSALQMAANGITEVVGAKADVLVEDNRIALRLQSPDKGGEQFLEAFYLQLQLLSQGYENTINLKISEVS